MPVTRRARRAVSGWAVAMASLGMIAAGSVTPAAAAPDEATGQPVGSTRLISRGLEGKPAAGDSGSVSVSDDGRFVAFWSRATDIVASPRCHVEESGCNYLHDRGTGATVLISMSPTGEAPNDTVWGPSISGDGRYVTYASSATNLVADDRNRHIDVFLYDRESATTTLANRSPEGEQANHASFGPVLSPDGSYVLYESRANNLVPGDRGWGTDVYRTDLVTGSTIVVSLTPRGKRPHGESTALDLSADGRVATYRSWADDIVPGDDNEKWDVFAFDVETGDTEVVSRSADGTVAAGNSGSGSISDDGRFVTFVSDAADVVPPDTGGHYDVFRLDRASGRSSG